MNGHVDCVRLLLNAGAYAADLNQEVLLIAEECGHHSVVELLVAEGAARDTSKWMGLKANACAPRGKEPQ
jgi:hypothetical protein